MRALESRPWRAVQGVLTMLACAVAAYALLGYALQPAGASVGEAMREVYRVHPALIHAHAFGAGLALLLGPWQFSARLRQRRRRWHRVIGWVYLTAGIVVGGVSGLMLSRLAQGGWVARLGFACLAVLWLWSGARGLRAILHRDPAAHRRWMLRNHALTLAAVTLRVYLGVVLWAGVPFAMAYPVIAWACWVPNLLIAHWWLSRRVRPRDGRLSTIP